MHHAEKVFPIAQNVIRHLHSDGLVHKELDGSIAHIFPGLDAEPEASTAAEAGFLVGVATAWLLMTSLKSGSR
jgi:hypothetical protein